MKTMHCDDDITIHGQILTHTCINTYATTIHTHAVTYGHNNCRTHTDIH